MRYKLLLFCLLSISLFSCKQNVVTGEGSVGTQTRDIVKNFEGIEVNNALLVTVMVNPAAPVSVSITGYENLLPHIKTEVSGKNLKIYVAETYRLENTGDLNITVTVPQLKSLDASGASKIVVPEAVRADQLSAGISGASEISLASVQISHLKADVSGASLLLISSGSISKLEADLSGSSKMDAFGVQAADANVAASGASKANVMVMQTLQADASGASSINYKGSPQVKSQASGAGSVNRAD